MALSPAPSVQRLRAPSDHRAPYPAPYRGFGCDEACPVSDDSIISFFTLLRGLDPVWGFAYLIGAILSWLLAKQAPKIIRELRRKPKK